MIEILKAEENLCLRKDRLCVTYVYLCVSVEKGSVRELPNSSIFFFNPIMRGVYFRYLGKKIVSSNPNIRNNKCYRLVLLISGVLYVYINSGTLLLRPQPVSSN